jgi:hypothetical protein
LTLPGFTLTDTPLLKRKQKLQERIKHLEQEMIVMQDKIAIMEAECCEK